MRVKVMSPDGQEIIVEAPEGATDEEIIAYAQANHKPRQEPTPAGSTAPVPAAPAPSDKRDWADVPLEALTNVPASAGKLVGGIYDAVTNLPQTLKGAGDIAAGGVRAGLRAILPGMEAKGNADTQRQDEMASAAWEALKARYGGEEQIKKTLATDPVGAMADLSTIFSGGATVAPKLATAAKWTDPIALAAKGVQKGAGLAGNATREILGKTTGVGAEALDLAYKAGKEGGESGKTYRQTVKGDISGDTVVQNARDAVETLYTDASDAYNAARAQWAGNPVPLDLAPIEASYKNLVASTQTPKGYSKISQSDQSVLTDIGAKISEFKTLHPNPTVADLDALKQSISNIVPESPMHTQQSRMIGNMRNSVKREIAKQSPEYEKAMRGYSDDMDKITEIRKTLSLGDKATTDTALRKLTSLTRNNVNTAYGHRMKLAKDLEEASGRQLLPALAGLANAEVMPRGIQGATITPSLAAMSGASMNPMWMAALAAASPRIVGDVYHTAGRVAGPVSRAAAIAPYGPAIARGGTIAGAGGNLYQEAEALAELKRKRRK